MKTYIKYVSFLAVFALIIGFARRAHASHSMDAEITYRHINGETYEFTVTFYRNCLGATATAPTSVSLLAKSNSLGFSGRTAGVLNKIGISGGQPATIYNCATATLCIEEYVYRGTVNLNTVNPANPYANDWVFYYELCCKSAGVMAPDNVTLGAIYTDCGLNNLNFPDTNNAPIWHTVYPNIPGHLNDSIISYPFKPVCADRWVNVYEDVKEYDGDIVRYELIQPRGNAGAPEPYVAPYTLAQPVQGQYNVPFEIDSLTGILRFKPLLTNPNSNIFLLTIKATEYGMISGVRTEKGYVTRDLTFYYEPSATCPGDNIALDENDIHLSCVDTSFNVEVTSNFNCKSIDPDASFVVMTDSASGNPVSVKSAEVACSVYNVSDHFKVNLNSPLNAGTYYFTLKRGTDTNTIVSECNTEILQYRDTIKVIVDSISMAQVQGSLDLSGSLLPYIAANCGQSEIEIELNAPVQCSSIDPSGSDFILFDSTVATPLVINVTAATPISCTKGVTTKIKLTFASAMGSGTYGLYLKQGTDGNSVINKCGLESSPQPIQVRNPELNVNLGPDLQYCKDSIFQALLEGPTGYASYSWNTGSGVRQLIVTTKGTYILTAGNGFGCVAMDTVVVREIDCSTGIAFIAQKTFEIYPNPSTGNLYLKNTGKDMNVQVSIRSIRGEEVFHGAYNLKPNTSEQLDISTLSKGVYFVHVSNGSQLLKVEKVVLK